MNKSPRLVALETLYSIFYDGSYSSQKKANNLKYELKRLLEGLPFVVCPATPNEIKLLGRAVR